MEQTEDTLASGCMSGTASEGDNTGIPEATTNLKDGGGGPPEPQMSKKQLKKLKQKQMWEEGREGRKLLRKEKLKARKERKRAAERDHENTGATAQNVPGNIDGGDGYGSPPAKRPKLQYSNWKEEKKHVKAVVAPITICFDCSFDGLMTDTELISLGQQLTRAYSDIRKSKFQPHMVVSSFGGKLRERFEGILACTHEKWKNVQFLLTDYIHAAALARKWMREDSVSLPMGALQTDGSTGVAPDACDENSVVTSDMVYLTSDSPNTLTRLEPFKTYIIGGLVDKNRHKGLCYRQACTSNVPTARLPIDEFMKMQSRSVLATNHVGEIMLKWVEHGDWGKAFSECIPKRKGGTLKDVESANVSEHDAQETPLVEVLPGSPKEISENVPGNRAATTNTDSA